ncbi:MAG: chemotaxis protein CheW [Leptospiraceae bacterium]|nr:chemotaxis protein CheW [Leptospiraceae bacterium]MCP5496962.1 chemotaxis protein CheW [Leptospiraceae bacterium]
MSENNEKIQLLTWTIDEQLFGLDIGKCREVDRDMKITAVPHSKIFIAGIVNLRGDVVTVIDLKMLLNNDSIPTESPKNVIIRLKSESSNIAIKADRISDILEISQDQIEPAATHLSDFETKYITHVGITDKGLVLILNSNELLNIKD